MTAISQTPNINHDEVVSKMSEMLKNSGWHRVLKGFLVSEDFKNILVTLAKAVGEDKRFTPPLKQVFRAFQECPFDKLRVIIVGQDPYPQLGVADGIAFSCGNTFKQEASLRYILHAVNDTVYDGKQDVKLADPSLVRWSNQGVLMLNTALTTEVGKIGKHFDIWQPFIAYLIDMLSKSDRPLIWVFMGKQAQGLAEMVDDHHQILTCSHPASAAYQKQHKWECNNVFNEVNNLLNDSPVVW
jgi:uracil-DNA glycosylase